MPSKRTASDLTAHLGYWLRHVSNHVSHAFALKLAKRHVTVAEWALMRSLYSLGEASPSALASAMGMTRGAVTKLADRLIAKDLMERTANPEDGRAQTLSLTGAAERLVPELAALADENDAEFFGHLTNDDRRALERFLKDIVHRRKLTGIPIN
ncbi:MAG TPA: MarR family transcriptional regulator [Roseiarcus sp.]|jgi:DNA-binding MarR family transcriptional regulator